MSLRESIDQKKDAVGLFVLIRCIIHYIRHL
jgi:hypothetical protein